MKQSLILIAHGSSDPNWIEQFYSITEGIRGQDKRTRLAFMELHPPSLCDVVEELVREEVEFIKVLPLFLAKGKHLRIDIPKQVEELGEKYGIKIELLDPIGEHPALAQAIETITINALN